MCEEVTEHFLELCDSDLRSLSAAFRSERLPMPISAVSLQRHVAGSLLPEIARELQSLVDKGFGTEQLATAIALILEDRKKRAIADDVIDLVTTGPAPGGVTNRDTSVVVRELFANTTQSVLVAGYAVYQGQRVFQALADRMQNLPQVKVRLFLDIQRSKDDTTVAAVLASKFKYRFQHQQWPVDRPLPELYYYPASLEATEKRSCLHAKCVVIDKERVFVSSANFTEAAQERNIEMGLLLRSKALAQQVTTHFDSLIASGDMQRLM